jgi:hypothetical protein
MTTLEELDRKAGKSLPKSETFHGVTIPKGTSWNDAVLIRFKTMKERPCPKWSIKTKWQHDIRWPERRVGEPIRYGATFYGYCRKCPHMQSNRC